MTLYDCCTSTTHRRVESSGTVQSSAPFVIDEDITCCEMTEIQRRWENRDRGIPARALGRVFWGWLRLARFAERRAEVNVMRRARRMDRRTT